MVFHNIFSKKEIKTENRNPILIDTREKQSLVASYLAEKNANIKFELLEVADYLIGDIAIERKTFSDFISSMINKRLFSQLEDLKKYPRYFLLIEGERKTTKNLENASKGMILSVITEYQIPIIFTENEEDTAQFLILLAKRQEKPHPDLGLRPARKILSEKERRQFILEGFPDIGPATAKKLLDKFKTLKEIFNANDEELKEILNKNQIENFRNLLS